MPLSNTNTTAAVDASTLFIPIASNSGFPAVGVIGSRQFMRLDGEMMMIDVVLSTTLVKVMMRGAEGTRAQAHDTLARVSTSSDPQDFGVDPPYTDLLKPEWTDDFLTIGQDTTFTAAGTAPVLGTSIPLPTKDTTYWITKGSACAITLISATAAQQGVRIRFLSATAFAHTVTYTPGFMGDTTTSDVATFAAKVGPSLEIICGPTGLWGAVNADLASSHDSGVTLG